MTFSPLFYFKSKRRKTEMAKNILRFSPSYVGGIPVHIQRRRAIVASLAYEDFTGKNGWIAQAVMTARKAGLLNTNEQMVKDDLLMLRKTWLWLRGDQATRQEFEQRRLHPSFTGVRNFLADGIDTWRKLERRMKNPKIKIYLGGDDIRLTTQRGATIIATLRVLAMATDLTLPIKELITATERDVRAISKNGSFNLNREVYFHVLRHMETKQYLSITYKDSGAKIATVKMATK